MITIAESGKKMGRPTTDPKQTTIKFRVSNEDIKRLEYCSEKAGVPKSEVLRMGIKEVYDKLKG